MARYDVPRYNIRVTVSVRGDDWDTEGNASLELTVASLNDVPKLGALTDGLSSAAITQHALKEKVKENQNEELD